MKAILPALLGAYLVAWFFWIGMLLGGLANIWLHNLTGGAWGEPIRAPLLRASRQVPLASVLFLPLLAGMHGLYPWAANAAAGAARWQGELSAPGFKNAWLSPVFFIARSIFYLVAWNVLATLSRRTGLERSKPFAAAALIVYGFSMSLAAVDWVMSLMPLWYSSVFGWLVGMGQMLAGMALGIVCAVPSPRKMRKIRKTQKASSADCRDLGNLLLMYVLMWAYLAFSQFLIIWAENLPHEIAWYVVRRAGPWPVLAWILAIFFFIAPLLILLSRSVKQTPGALAALAAALLGMQFLDTCWLVLPSVAIDPAQWMWAVPLAGAMVGTIAFAGRRYMPSTTAVAAREDAHV
jgi:hypothetical protein